MIRLAIFDLDGTLIDSKLDLALATNDALRKVGLPERPIDEIASFVGEGAVKLVERAVAPRADLVEPALALWWEHYRAHLLDHTVLYPGLGALIRRAPFEVAVHTNKPGQLARDILRGLGVLERFVEVVGGDEAPRKPSPEAIHDLLRRRGATPGEAVLVGDSLIDLRTARNVPVRFVGVAWGLVGPEPLEAEGSGHLARSSDELAAALDM